MFLSRHQVPDLSRQQQQVWHRVTSALLMPQGGDLTAIPATTTDATEML